MLIFTKISDLRAFLAFERKTGRKVGFVPTMGALHSGHLSLIETASKQCDVVLASIFVNPTQFNDKKDLERYPRTVEADLELLRTTSCHAVFTPSVEEIYPKEETVSFDFGQLDKVLEGSHRPGHFNGVAQVVKKLFEITEPDKAFFGMKDMQQLMIIQALVKQMNIKTEIIPCPTLRESDGLAMSSRNRLLNEKERMSATLIPKILFEAKENYDKGNTPEQIKMIVQKKFSSDPIYKLDYFAICEKQSLKEISSFEKDKEYIALIACFVGKIRLIDNLIL